MAAATARNTAPLLQQVCGEGMSVCCAWEENLIPAFIAAGRVLHIFLSGDTIGVLYDRIERTISFSKNGHLLGIAFRDVAEDTLYPTVGFRTPDEEILANFGESSFVADVDLFRRESVARVQASVRETSLEGPSGQVGLVGGMDIREMINNLCREGDMI